MADVDIERIGDYSKNIVDLAREHTSRLDVAEHEEELRGIEQATLGLFDRTIVAFKDGDVEEGRLRVGDRIAVLAPGVLLRDLEVGLLDLLRTRIPRYA